MSAGAVTTVAGSGSATTSAGTGTAAGLGAPTATAMGSGVVFVAGADYLASYSTSSDAVTIVAGQPGTIGCADGSAGSSVTMKNVSGLATDGTSVYSVGPCGLRKTSIATGATTTLAGTPVAKEGVTWPGDGYLYTTSGKTISRVDPSTGAAITFVTVSGGCNGSVAHGLASDTTSLYAEVNDVDCSGAATNQRIDQISLSSGSDTTLYSDAHLVFDTVTTMNGYVYAAHDVYGCGGNACNGLAAPVLSGPRIVQIAVPSGATTPIVGAGPGYANGTGTDGWFGGMGQMTGDGTNLFVPDTADNRLRQVAPGTPLPESQPAAANSAHAFSYGAVQTISGNASNTTTAGSLSTASYNQPEAIAADGSMLYVGDRDAISKVDVAGNSVSVLAGQPGTTGGTTEAPNGADATISGARALTSDGHYLYELGGFIYRTNLQTGGTSLVGAEDSGSNVYQGGLAIGPDGTLYTSTEGKNNITAVNPITGKASTFYTFANHGECDDQLLSMAADATNLYVTRTTVGCFGDPRQLTLWAINFNTQAATSYPIDTSGNDDYTSPGAIASVGDSVYVGYHQVNENTSPVTSLPWQLVRIPKAGGAVIQVAGGVLGDADGIGGTAGFSSIDGITSDGTDLFVVEQSGLVRKVSAANPAIPAGGPTWPGELTGGSNPSELSTTCSCNDPVNTATGQLWETTTDLAVPGRGPGLNFARTYDSSQAAASGPLGPGWRDSYQMQLTDDPSDTGEPLGQASIVDVVQENGSVVPFARQSGGTYTAPSRAFATLTHNGDGSWTFLRNRRDTFTFDSAGALTAITDLDGYTTTLTYNGPGKLATVTDSAGRALTLTYSNGLLSTLTDPAGRTVSYGYDATGRLNTVTDPAGRVTAYGYDSSNRLTSVTDPRGDATTTKYGGDGRVSSQTDRRGKTTTFSYSNGPSAANDTVTMTDPNGNVTSMVYANDELTSETRGAGTATAATTTFGYDPTSNGVTTVKDADGNTTTSSYDAYGDLLSVKDPLGNTQSWTYNNFGEPLTHTDANNVTTTYSYTATGDLKSESTPLTGTSQTRTTSYTYGDTNHPGDVTATTSPDGYTTSYSYDRYGQLTSVTDPDGNTTTYSYSCGACSANYPNIGWIYTTVSPRGNVSGGTPANYTTSYTYNADGDQLSVTDPSGNTTSYTYNADADVTSVTDANNHTTTNSYNANDQLASTTKPNNAVLQYGYDADGNLTSLTDANNHTTSYSYNPLNRVSSKTDADNRTTAYTYDGDGNLLTTTQPGGSCTANPATGCITDSYNNGDQLTGTTYTDGTHAVSYSYDPNGRRTAMTDGTGTSSWTYDSLGRLTQTQDGSGSTVSYGYDLDGNRTTITYPNNQTVTDSYDHADQLTKVTDWNGNTTTITPDPDGNTAAEAYPNGVTANYTYDPTDTVSSITDSTVSGLLGTGTTLASFSYTRNNLEQVTAATQTGAGQGNRTYSYDTNNRLTTDTAGSPNYGYDPADNPTTLPGGTTQTFDGADQLTTTTTSTNTTAYSDDSQGERTQSLSTAAPLGLYRYNQAGDLTAATAAPGAGAGSAGGYWAYTAKGNVLASTKTNGYGAVNGTTANITGMAATPTGKGYWLTTSGTSPTVTPYGDAETVATNASEPYANSVIGIAANPTGGYYLYTGHGNVYNTTDATFYGSNTAQTGIVGMAVTPDGKGYWLVQWSNSTATTYAHGDAAAINPSTTPANPVIGVVANPNGGYYDYTAQGNVYNTADAHFYGSPKSSGKTISNIVGMDVTPDGKGYWLIASDGTLYNYGDAGNVGFTNNINNYTPTGIVARPNLTTYSYDGNGLRVSSTNQKTTAHYTYDQASDMPLVIADGTNYYLYGPDDQPIEQINASTGTTSYLSDDQLGSTRLITNSAGVVAGTYSYDAYGNTTNTSGTVTTPLQYAGQYNDTTDNLYWLRARYYDPTTAQFLTRDPAEALTKAPYSYANDDPIDESDPLGLWGWNPISDISQAAGDVAGGVASGAEWVYHHPADTAGLVLGAAAAATGVGAVIEGATFVGLGLSVASVGAGAAAAGLDANRCFSGDTVACVGFGLGGASAVAGLFPVAGTSLVLGGAIEEGALADALLNYLPVGLGLNLGLAGLSLDFASPFFGDTSARCQ